MSEPQKPILDLTWLWEVLEQRRREGDPAESYTRRLLERGVDRIAQKVGEEATETIIAGLRLRIGAGREEVIGEAADLLYHLLVFLMACEVSPVEVLEELAARHRQEAAGSASHEEDEA